MGGIQLWLYLCEYVYTATNTALSVAYCKKLQAKETADRELAILVVIKKKCVI